MTSEGRWLLDTDHFTVKMNTCDDKILTFKGK